MRLALASKLRRGPHYLLAPFDLVSAFFYFFVLFYSFFIHCNIATMVYVCVTSGGDTCSLGTARNELVFVRPQVRLCRGSIWLISPNMEPPRGRRAVKVACLELCWVDCVGQESCNLMRPSPWPSLPCPFCVFTGYDIGLGAED